MEVCPPKVVKCDECEKPRKEMKTIFHCDSCEQYLCDACDKKMHGKGKRQAHERKEMAAHTHFAPGTPPVAAHGGIPASVSQCDECEGPKDTVKVRCDACEQWLCEKCNTKLHKAGKRMAHVRKYFGGGSAEPVQGDKEVAPASVKACSECETPRDELSTVCRCDPCEQWLCEPCDDKLHKKGKRMAHVRKHYNTKNAAAPEGKEDLAPAAATKCDECESARDTLDHIIRCDACEQWLCEKCDDKMHKKGKRMAHERHAYVTKSGGKALAKKAAAPPAASPKSPVKERAERALSESKDEEAEKKKKEDEDKKKKEDAAKKKKEEEAAKKAAEEEKKRKEEEKQKAAAEKAKQEQERVERENKRKQEEEKRAKEKAALEEKKKKEEEELRLKIEQEMKEQLEKEEAEKAERKKQRDEKRRIKAEKQAKKEAEEKAAAEKAEAERALREKAEGELRAKLEAEARAKIEAETRARIEAEMRAKAEEEQRAKEKKERAEKKAKEEKERAEKKAKEEKERQERIAREKEEMERKLEEERKRIEAEEKAAAAEREREEREAQEREAREREEAEAAERERAEAEAADKRAAASQPKRRPPTIVGGKGGKDKAAAEEPAEEEEVEVGPEEDVNYIKRGFSAVKHDTSFGKKTQKRDLWYEPGLNGGNLQWGRPGEKRVADKKKQLPIQAIQEIYVGKSSASFKKIKEGKDECCCTVISKERSLDLESNSESERDQFVRALQHVCKENMFSIQMHGAPKSRPKKKVPGGAGTRAMSPSRALSPQGSVRRPNASASTKSTIDFGGKDDAPAKPAPRKKPAAGDKRVCDDCLDPAAVLAVQCEECEQVLCADCDARIHKKGTRAAHQRGPYVEGGAGAAGAAPGGDSATKHLCQDCQDSANEVVCHCQECEQFLCHDCDNRIHKKGTRSKHVRDYLSDNPPALQKEASVSSFSRDGALSPAKSSGKSESDSKEQLGNTAFNNKKYDKAAGYFTELINQNPQGYKYFLKRCNCYFFLEKYAESLADANSAIDLAPQVLEGYAMKGKALDKLGKNADAIAAVQEGLRIEPANAQLKAALAKLKEEAPAPPKESAAPAAGKKGHIRQPSRPPPPPDKKPPSSAVSVFNPDSRPTVSDWDGEKEDEIQKKDKDSAGNTVANLKAAAAGAAAKAAAGKKGPPPLPGGKAAPAKKEPPPLKKIDKSKTENLERALSPGKAAAKKEEPKEEPAPAAEEPPAGGEGDEWQEHLDTSSGKKYWHNPQTQETTWDDPHAPKAGAAEEEWGEAKDPSTGKTYWFNTKTGATTWDDPHGSEWAQSEDPATGKPFWYHVVSGQTTWDNPSEAGKKKEPVNTAAGPAIPAGMAVPKVVTVKNAEWTEHKDPTSGNTYFVNSKTQATTWSNPHQWNEWVDKGTGKKYWHNEVTNVTTWEYPK